MFSFISIDHSDVEKLPKASGNSVVVTAIGDGGSGVDAELYGTHGIVSRASKKTKGIRIRIGSLSIVIAAYTYGVEPPSNEGACKVYGTDASGVEKVSMTFDPSGKVDLKNAAETLAGLCGDLIDEIKAIETTGSSVHHFVDGATQSRLSTLKTRFQSLLTEL